MGTVLILGNGFDLHHNKQTKYSDFLRYLGGLKAEFDAAANTSSEATRKMHTSTPLQESSLFNFFVHQHEIMETNYGWIDMEAELKRLIRSLIRLIDDANESRLEGGVWGQNIYQISQQPADYQILLKHLKSLFDEDRPGFARVKNKYIDNWGKIDLNAVLKQLDDELSGIEGLLGHYLSEVEPNIPKKKIQYENLMVELDPDYIISFNYTNTCEKTYKFDKNKICYVHGSITNRESIVLGYDDSDNGLDDILFKKYYRRLTKETDVIDTGELCYQDSCGIAHYKTAVFFGHSLDISDVDILKGILETRREIVIYVLDKGDRAEKTANLIKLLGKGKVIEGIQSGRISFKTISPV